MSEPTFANLLRIIGKGPNMSRPLTQDEARAAARHIFSGNAQPMQTTAVQFEHASAIGVVEHSCEQTVVRRNEIVLVVFNNQNVTFGADARIDNSHVYAAGREILI